MSLGRGASTWQASTDSDKISKQNYIWKNSPQFFYRFRKINRFFVRSHNSKILSQIGIDICVKDTKFCKMMCSNHVIHNYVECIVSSNIEPKDYEILI